MNRLILKAVTFALAMFGSGLAVADDHGAGPTSYGISYGFNVSDPAAVIAAMDKLRKSRTGRKNPVDVTLSRVVAAGENDVTHIIQVMYDTAAEIDEAAAINEGSKAWAEFLESMQGVAERKFVNMFTVEKARVTEGAVTAENPVALVYALKITDPGAFMSAFETMWDSETANAFPGNAFFGSTVANGATDATHYVSFLANDMATLLGGIRSMQASDDMAAYFQAVGPVRSLVFEGISARVKSWPAASK